MIRHDKKLRAWFKEHPFEETTVMQCEVCGFMYKPSLGHICEKVNKCGDCAFAIRGTWGGKTSDLYVECTNEEHIKKWCKNDTARTRQKTHLACKNFKEKGGAE